MQPADYLQQIIDRKNFWLSLSGIELRGRFRRTNLGVLWCLVHPLMFALILSLVFHFIFQQDFFSYSVYVYSGIVLWTWFGESVILGANAIMHCQSFMRQCRLPAAIYPLKSFLVATATFLLGMTGVLAWCLAIGFPLGWGLLILPINFAFLAICLLPLSIASSVLGTLYRDFTQAVQVLLQALWFVTPVFLDKSAFLRPYLSNWDMLNPVSNMLELIRKPLMDNSAPFLQNYAVTLVFGLAIAIAATVLLRNHERHLVYYA